MNRVPPDAFEHYVSLGPGRSYEAVAKHFGVSKKAITKHAVAEGWQKRHAEIEKRARRRSDDQIVETIDEMNTRHLKTMQAVQRKGLMALKDYPLTSAMDAVRALEVAVRHERLIRGEPSERTATTVEDVIRREYNRWMTSEESPNGQRAERDDEDEEDTDDTDAEHTE